MESRDSIVKYLKTLADKELAEVFYDAVRDRLTSDVEELKGHFVLADVSYDEGKWSVDVIAREDPAEYKDGWASAVPVCQWGVCQTCSSRVRSWAKHMLCPVCGAKAYGS